MHLNTQPLPARPSATRGSAIVTWVRRHPLSAYFALAYTFSWALWLGNPNQGVGNYGPAFAALAVSATLTPEPVRGSWLRRGAVFASGFTVALAVWTLFLTSGQMDASWVEGVVSSVFIGVLVSGPIGTPRGVCDLLAPLKTWRVGWAWYVVALLYGPAVLLAGVGADLALGGPLPPPLLVQASLPSAAVGIGFFLLFGGGLQEEPGWRGFALPRLQRRVSPLVASLILGSLWAFWHAPLYFSAGIPTILASFMWVLPMAVVFTYVYNRSAGSLLIAVLLHVSINGAEQFIPLSARASLLGLVVFPWGVALIVIVAGRMWRKTSLSAPIVLRQA